MKIEMVGVNEYTEGHPVYLTKTDGRWEYNVETDTDSYIGAHRTVIQALNEGGQASTEIDLLQLIEWLKTHKPDLLK